MGRQFFRILLFMLVLLVVSSCAGEDISPALTSTETSWPTATLVPSDTPTHAPPTATFTLTPTPYLAECVQPEEVDQIETEGAVILDSIGVVETSISIKLDDSRFETFQNVFWYSGIVASPDRSKLAFIQDSPRMLVIVAADGSILHRYSIPENWIKVLDWTSENRLFIEKRLYFGESSFESGQLVVYNLETSGFDEIQPEFPGINSFVEFSPWIGNMIFLPDPALNYTVYCSGNDVILWDLFQQEEIMRVYGESTHSTTPIWGRNGEWFITAAALSFTDYRGRSHSNFDSDLPYVEEGYDLYKISVSGDIQRLTFFSTQYLSDQSGWSLSPDETKLVFWVDTDYGDGVDDWQLALLDIPTGELRTYCVSGGNYREAFEPVWSPGGGKLIVPSYYVDQETFRSSLDYYIIDLEANQIAVLPEDGWVGAWLTLGE